MGGLPCTWSALQARVLPPPAAQSPCWAFGQCYSHLGGDAADGPGTPSVPFRQAAACNLSVGSARCPLTMVPFLYVHLLRIKRLQQQSQVCGGTVARPSVGALPDPEEECSHPVCLSVLVSEMRVARVQALHFHVSPRVLCCHTNRQATRGAHACTRSRAGLPAALKVSLFSGEVTPSAHSALVLCPLPGMHAPHCAGPGKLLCSPGAAQMSGERPGSLTVPRCLWWVPTAGRALCALAVTWVSCMWSPECSTGPLWGPRSMFSVNKRINASR